jgi:hypothetical protein
MSKSNLSVKPPARFFTLEGRELEFENGELQKVVKVVWGEIGKSIRAEDVLARLAASASGTQSKLDLAKAFLRGSLPDYASTPPLPGHHNAQDFTRDLRQARQALGGEGP